jgi:hypothetical protein
MNDQDADWVMGDIDDFEQCPLRYEELLNHLNEMHKLRDEKIYDYVWDGLIELNDGFTVVTHPSFATFLQM